MCLLMAFYYLSYIRRPLPERADIKKPLIRPQGGQRDRTGQSTPFRESAGMDSESEGRQMKLKTSTTPHKAARFTQ